MIICFDNNPYREGLTTGWGFSCLIKLPYTTILFDTGNNGDILLNNLKSLYIEPTEIDTVFLSHMDYDHIGGMNTFLKHNNQVTAYVPQSFPQDIKTSIASSAKELVEIGNGRILVRGVFTTGELGKSLKEQALILSTTEGSIIITGCAHPGIVQILRQARGITKDSRIYMAIGGFHLISTSVEKIESIIGELNNLNVRYVCPCHCSGDRTRELFKEKYGASCILGGVGMRIRLPRITNDSL